MALGELSPLPAEQKRGLSAANAATLAHVRDDFTRAPVSAIASDLMGAALVLDQRETVLDVAEMVISEKLPAGAATRRVAERVLESGDGADALPSAEILDPNGDAQRGELRRLLAESPRNALRWTDLARLQTAIGKDREADRAMKVARALAPEDRHVLRSSARLAIHSHRPGDARALLQAAARTRRDPWLMACEISAAEIMEERSPLIRNARELLADARFSDYELSELASVLATIELEAGDLRASRQLFRKALQTPSDNSIAQVTWAAPQLGMEYDEQALAVPASWEARAIEAHRSGDWDRASDEATRWLDDQPFASRPGELGSYEASKGGDFQRGLELAERAIPANPKEFLLRNNAAFCLLSMNEPARAKVHLDAIEKDKLDDGQLVTWTATRGLYQYRTNAPERGRALYLRAIRASRDSTARALATIMMAREELRVGFEGAAQTREQAIKLAERDQPELGAWVEQIAPEERGVTLRAPASKPRLTPPKKGGTRPGARAPKPRTRPDLREAAPRPRLPSGRRRSSR
jgi:tetratricopeptide (TPR) repeat protein